MLTDDYSGALASSLPCSWTSPPGAGVEPGEDLTYKSAAIIHQACVLYLRVQCCQPSGRFEQIAYFSSALFFCKVCKKKCLENNLQMSCPEGNFYICKQLIQNIKTQNCKLYKNEKEIQFATTYWY